MGTVYNTNVVTDGLVCYFDGGNRKSYPSTGTVWADVASGNDGTLTNWVDGDFTNDKMGYLGFDGSDGYCAVPGATVDFRDKMSLFAWVNFNSLSGSGVAWIGKIKASNAQYALEYTASKFKVALYVGGWKGFQSGFSLSTGTWYYLGFTYDRVNVKTYANGVFAPNDGTDSPSAQTDPISGDSLNLTIGGGGWNGGVTRDANVEIALVKLYNRALTAAEVLQNYNATKGRFT